MEMDSLEHNTDELIGTNDLVDEVDCNFDKINNEYDQFIDNLHKRLQIMRENRKKAESESEILKNRVVLLQSQEKTAVQKFERTKSQINQIIENRKHFKFEDNRTKSWRENKKKEAEDLKNRVQKLKMMRSSLKSVDGKQSKEDLNRSKTNQKRLEQKMLMKERIKKKLEMAELERKSLETILAQIEKQEMDILLNIKNEKKKA